LKPRVYLFFGLAGLGHPRRSKTPLKASTSRFRDFEPLRVFSLDRRRLKVESPLLFIKSTTKHSGCLRLVLRLSCSSSAFSRTETAQN
ncbi:MAG: hypothetical protein Q6356_006545, partial [Candidatus Wukongarchaeota archaeon]|nr:hypothetical protein [Candidatus Wukongarchaeota archaeon]